MGKVLSALLESGMDVGQDVNIREGDANVAGRVIQIDIANDQVRIRKIDGSEVVVELNDAETYKKDKE